MSTFIMDWSRQSSLVDQRTLGRANVLILGVGATGMWVAANLASMGVGKLTLVDHDRIELSNVNRQSLYCNYIGMFKAIAMKDIIERLINPKCVVEAMPFKLLPEEIDYGSHLVIINATDDLRFHGEIYKYTSKEGHLTYLSPRMDAWQWELFTCNPKNEQIYFSATELTEEERKLFSCTAQASQISPAIITTTQFLAAVTAQATLHALHNWPWRKSIRGDVYKNFAPPTKNKEKEGL